MENSTCVCRRAVQIRKAIEEDIPHILVMIRGLAEYEKFDHLLAATPESLRDSPFREEAGRRGAPRIRWDAMRWLPGLL